MTKPITDAARELRNYIVAIRDSGFEGGFVRRHWKDQANAALANIDAIDSEVAKAVPPGYVVVPKKITDKMKINAAYRFGQGGYFAQQNVENIWNKCIADRPPLPQSIDIAKVVGMADELADTAKKYFDGYVQDEAEEREVCISDQQHEDAIALREVLATYAAFKKENGL